MELELKAVLNEEAKSKLKEERIPSFYGGKPTGHDTEYYIGRTRVTIRQGVIHSEVPILWPVSEEIKPYITGFLAEASLDQVASGITRDKGKYALPGDEKKETKETIGIVESEPYSNKRVKIICYGPDREKVLELYNLIRAGYIRPYEVMDLPQAGKSCKQLEEEVCFLKDHKTGLEAEIEMLEAHLRQTKESEAHFRTALDQLDANLAQARQEIVDLQKKLELSEATFRSEEQNFRDACEKNVRLRQLVRNMENESLLPLVFRSTVTEQINAILDNSNK